MFVRAVWRNRRLVDLRPGRREAPAPTDLELMGVSRPDFRNMTRGLFDR